MAGLDTTGSIIDPSGVADASIVIDGDFAAWCGMNCAFDFAVIDADGIGRVGECPDFGAVCSFGRIVLAAGTRGGAGGIEAVHGNLRALEIDGGLDDHAWADIQSRFGPRLNGHGAKDRWRADRS